MFLPKTDRKIIPRWRDFWTTAALGQLSPSEADGAARVTLPNVAATEALQAWRRSRTLWHALDVVGVAFVLGDSQNPDVVDAARYVENSDKDISDSARVLVARILRPDAQHPLATEGLLFGEMQIRREIHDKRLRLSNEPRNSILWTDIAHLYVSIGRTDKARHAIEMAYALSPDNRFVVRSGARFLNHIGDNEEALRLLRKTITKQPDPWIVAAEIGISSRSGSRPQTLKIGRSMADDRRFTPFAISELASAIATIDLNEGNKRAAKKLFRRSLDLPTENSVAQAEWASTQVGDLQLPTIPTDIPRNFEAQAVHEYRIGHFQNAVGHAVKWLADQSFSSRPANVASYLYNLLDRYEEALEVLSLSLVTNPGDRGLINNKAFTLINLGRLDAAELLIKQTDPRAVEDSSTITLIATEGLLRFRRGLVETGRHLYLDAIELAKRNSNHHYAALAALRLAIEEIRANSGTRAESFREAMLLASRSGEADVKHFVARLEIMAKVARMI